MNKLVKYILLSALFAFILGLFSGISGRTNNSMAVNQTSQKVSADTNITTRYPVKKTQITTFEDLSEKNPVDLRTPSNVKTEVEYDIKNNVYLFKTKLGDQELTTPFSMTQKEYNDYTLKQSMADYFRVKNNEVQEKGTTKDVFNLKDISIPIGPAERIFGPGGVKIRPQGYVEFSAGIKRSKSESPTLSERKRTTTIFDVDQKINLSVNASVGDKMNFDLNYNTEAAFDFDSKKMKLAYEGKEDEIIKYLEAGNVSLNTTNSLIAGASSLFGIRADLQFGKLRVNTVISQQESESKSVGSKGGVQSQSFDFMAVNYEENANFFLGHYFRDDYDRAMERIPYVNTSVSITKMEVWVTNTRGSSEQNRDIIAFVDLAEHDVIKNNMWSPYGGGQSYPSNESNSLYSTIINNYSSARDINQVTGVLEGIGLENGQDFERLQNARLLSSSEYTFNPKLGYISLTGFSLQPADVLAVYYEYEVNGKVYRVGEPSASVPSQYVPGKNNSGALILKLLKPVSLSPDSYAWDLMMKNVYRIGAYNVQSDRFRLNISYQNDTLGTYVDRLPVGDINNKRLINVMNLDRLDSRLNPVISRDSLTTGDGIFDFVEGLTITSSNGRVIFPVVEPFGSYLKKKINNDTEAEKYLFNEIYTLSKTEAEQVAEKNKYKISGSYRASNSNEIDLGVTNVVKGSVRVTAGGKPLAENVDYTVDYMGGKVIIINQGLIDSKASISATVENQSFFNMQKKTLLGTNISYDFSKNFTIGTTLMHMYEKPLTTKATIGSEAVKNTLIGFNTSFRTESQWLTNLLDKIPFVEATAPSQIAFNGEFAKMIPGHYKNKYAGGYSYLDDFESSRSRISMRDPYGWSLSSTPSINFKDDAASSKMEYNQSRALLSWYYIDRMFTRESSTNVPQHIKNDKEQLSSHFVREVRVDEIYPNRETMYNETAVQTVLNLSYYPEQRGPYNLNIKDVNPKGKFNTPDKKWGGITRSINQTDFEATNVEYIEFWLMDPFVYNGRATSYQETDNEGGTLYFNLGEVSEEVLKDGYKFYENGIPADNDTTQFKTTYWGRVPTRPATVYAFDNSQSKDMLRAQDVGYNGLSTKQEFEFDLYKNYVNDFRGKVLDSDAKLELENDPFSPFNDPAGDNYHYFRGSDYDRRELSILDRYKYVNNSEGNTIGHDEKNYSTSYKTTPDVEDLNQDFTMNETESFFQYKVELKPNGMTPEANPYLADTREVSVQLANGKTEQVKWYQFKIPIKDPTEKQGNIRSFKTIRFMRMFMTDFKQTTHLRFATLDLVRGEWRAYTQPLEDNGLGNGELITTSVNIEENSTRTPVSYVVPPGVSRILDPGQPQLRQENEQALSLKVVDLQAGKSRAVHKGVNYDLRRYKRIQMFVHAESVEKKNPVEKGDFAVFMRLGTDYKNNYYEYEIPLSITPAGTYNTNNYNDQLAVWPKDNMFDFPLELLKDAKLVRNKKRRQGDTSISYVIPYDKERDPEKPSNRITVMGNPSLAEVSVIMIGVRNISDNRDKSVEVWVNELRLGDFDEEGGWAAQGSLNIAFSDIGTLQLTGRKETAGFGSIEQSLMERRQDDFTSYSISTNVDLGRFVPEKVKASIPLYYTYSNETVSPKYDPLDKDVTLKESLSLVKTKAEKDSIKSLAQDKVVSKSFSISGAKFNIRSKTPMPYDPANFSFGYAQSMTETKDPNTVYDQVKNYSAKFSYNYSPMAKTWEPFKNIKSKAPMAKYAKSLGFNFWPSNIAINSDINRYYTETVIRDLENYVIGQDTRDNEFLSFSSNFYWDRDFSLQWDFTKNLRGTLQTGTKAEIEEPFLQVNKKVNPDAYDEWKDAVQRSILKFGSPLTYRQTASLVYNLPFNNIPFLDWINSTANYNSTYNWDKGATVEGEGDLGNTIRNSLTFSVNNRINMVNLYNKWEFLKKVNQKFAQTTSSRNTGARPAARPAPRKKKFEKLITLSNDSTVTLVHNLNTKNIQLTAKREDDNRTYPIKFKKIDKNKVRITSKDSIVVRINILEKGEQEESTWYKIAQYSARGLMSVRSFTVNYSIRNENSIYGFKPGIGDFFGQSNSMVPGLGFAFGFDGDEDFVEKSLDRNWLVGGTGNINPAVFSKMEKLDINAVLEPVRGLKIDLKAFRENAESNTLRISDGGGGTYDRSYLYGGNFSMSVLTISSAFESLNANKGYQSKSFEKFLSNRETLRNRLQQKYDSRFPNRGGTVDKVDANSADILIPAFISAYMDKDANKVSFSPILAFSSMFPGWNITYDGLTTLPWFKDKFKSFKITHSYNSQYRIGSYSSFAGWLDLGDNMGLVESVQGGGRQTPSSRFDIGSVSIIEDFNPLLGLEGTLKNSMTLKARYIKGRALSLNIASFQIVETIKNEIVVGMGYRISEFNRIVGLTPKRGVNNDLNITGDLSFRKNQSLLRRIEGEYTQATSGSSVTTLKMSADYTMTKALTLRAYFDKVINRPLMSASAPSSVTNFGISIRFNLTQ